MSTDESWKEFCFQREQNGEIAEGECGVQEGRIFCLSKKYTG